MYNRGNNAYSRDLYEQNYFHEKNAEIHYIEELQKRKAKRIEKLNFVFSLRVLLAIVVTFTISLAVMVSIAATKHQQTNIVNLNNTLKEIQEKNLELKGKITESIDLAYVEEYAKSNLNMAPPEEYQIIYIDVPKASYSVSYSNVGSEKEDSFFSGIIKFLSGD